MPQSHDQASRSSVTSTPPYAADRPSGLRQRSRNSTVPRSSGRRRRLVILIEDTESESSDPDEDIAWDTHFAALTISPTRRATSTPAHPPHRTTSTPAHLPIRTTSPTAPPAYTAPSVDELEQHYRQRFGALVPSPRQITPSDVRRRKYYVVTRGLRVGVFEDWSTVHRQVNGVSGASYKAYRTFEDALQSYTHAYEARIVELVDCAPSQ
ncbi:hypothetical protein V5O48_014580 [Marasmius crinis-equi]|uniref:Ribonuclease H1 N-terminal domain-containing protein n=1 Tax=Marasmius crinis-equi TaxID=585013 RepID=A0ABR3EWW4_9AGAR